MFKPKFDVTAGDILECVWYKDPTIYHVLICKKYSDDDNEVYLPIILEDGSVYGNTYGYLHTTKLLKDLKRGFNSIKKLGFCTDVINFNKLSTVAKLSKDQRLSIATINDSLAKMGFHVSPDFWIEKLSPDKVRVDLPRIFTFVYEENHRAKILARSLGEAEELAKKEGTCRILSIEPVEKPMFIGKYHSIDMSPRKDSPRTYCQVCNRKMTLSNVFKEPSGRISWKFVCHYCDTVTQFYTGDSFEEE